ncbi:GrpB family protein [Jeotgalicoccus halotolerans]|uniref:GrpB family protein n=1 Tax=Jeotgalicoccus halotolerans TaxID=157227 RepID=UPI0013BEA2BA
MWKNLIFFRDYLNNNEYSRHRYLNIKEEFLRSNSEGIREYTDYKEAFVKEIIDKRT